MVITGTSADPAQLLVAVLVWYLVISTNFALSANSLRSRTHALSLTTRSLSFHLFRSPCQRVGPESPLCLSSRPYPSAIPPPAPPFTPYPLPLLLRCSIEFDQPSRSSGICPLLFQFPGAPLPHLISPSSAVSNSRH